MDTQSMIVVALFLLSLVCVVWLFLRDSENKRKAEYRQKTLGEVLPNRLQAYERMSLYLCRIDPEEMAIREQVTASNAKDLYLAMINAVRQEFDHNAAMQIYISEASWKRVCRAKEEVAKTLKDSMKEVHPDAQPIELSADFIERARNTCNFYVERAKDGLRRDIAGDLIDD